MNDDLMKSLITFIVGGGLFTLITQLIRGWSSLRSGSRASIREVIKDLAASRDEAEERLRTEQKDKEYWRDRAGGYHYQMRMQGLTPDPLDPSPPSAEHRQRRRRPGGPRAEESS